MPSPIEDMGLALRNKPLVRRITSRMFAITGRDIDSRWYSHYKLGELSRVVDQPFDPNKLPRGFGRHLDERIVEYPWLLSRLPAGNGRLLDAGSVLNCDFALHHPKLRDKHITIMTLAPETECFWDEGISYVFGDLRETGFRDDYFDCVVCLSTLEHIGLDSTLFYTSDLSKKERNATGFMTAIKELHRVLKSGGSCYVSVPFGRAEVRSWLQIFDGSMVDRVIETFGPKDHHVAYFRYTTHDGWQRSSREASEDAGYFDVHFDTPWPGCPAAAEAVACLELTK